MPGNNTALIYAHIVASIELLAAALGNSSDPKLVEKDRPCFHSIEDSMSKIDLLTLDENALVPIEETLALISKNAAFYGEEESAVIHYLQILYRDYLLKNRPVDPAGHKKQLDQITLLSKRQTDERSLKEIERQLDLLTRSAPLPGSLAYKDYQTRRDDLTKKKKEIEGRLFRI